MEFSTIEITPKKVRRNDVEIRRNLVFVVLVVSFNKILLFSRNLITFIISLPVSCNLQRIVNKILLSRLLYPTSRRFFTSFLVILGGLLPKQLQDSKVIP